ncbi:TATA element modulatory factor 1 TATA binding-domain-containing protein [Trichophaea hybrida]|nr:TATA element modulatory factor 1 TATA binding-domain-containing protein [Trichophaea hybrida]
MNFLQKGLAGLESRLDKVLLDEPSVMVTAQPPKISMPPAEAPVRKSGDLGRSSMQERLAAAVKSGRNSPVPHKKLSEEQQQQQEEKPPTPTPPPPPLPEPETNGTAPPLELQTHDLNTPKIQTTTTTTTDTQDADLPRADLLALISQLREDLITCETRRQEETHDASERTDALSLKLCYLSQESAAAARERITSSPTTAEKKLAERDEKIALLIEEGEHLARNELKLQTTIKKLRAQVKDAGERAKKQDAGEKALREEREKVRKLVEAEKRVGERLKGLEKVEGEVEMLRKENEALEVELRESKERLESVEKKVEEAEGKVQTEALEAERKNTIELRAQVERAQSEAVMVEEKLKGEIADLKNKMERDMGKARAREVELKVEQSVMESKLEALRARLEEASSGSTGDAHAKLLRQVETLQTQYAIASENWQGIEGSLLARVASLEKERDDLAKKEGDIRRKAREMNLKHQALESSLESAESKLKDLESDLTSAHELTSALRVRLSAAESSAATARTNFERELQTRLQEERAAAAAAAAETTVSPPPPPHPQTVASTTESYFLGFQNTRKPSARSVSAEPLHHPRSTNGFHTPLLPRNDSFPLSPAVPPDDDSSYFEGVTPSSPHHRHPDLVSVSTVAAGPSVQLVERMSAAVRRLESEMAGSREELARVQGQRDEGRREIVELMREVEGKRKAEERVRCLEGEIKELGIRMETTLELLGRRQRRWRSYSRMWRI